MPSNDTYTQRYKSKPHPDILNSLVLQVYIAKTVSVTELKGFDIKPHTKETVIFPLACVAHYFYISIDTNIWLL